MRETDRRNIDVRDYEDHPGSIATSARRGLDGGQRNIRLRVKDHDAEVIVYPTIEQAQELVVNLLHAIREAKEAV